MHHEVKTRAHKKRKKHAGGSPVETGIGGRGVRKAKTRGGGEKTRLVSADFANVVISGKPVKCEISSLEKNPAKVDYTRRKIITKGAEITVKHSGKDVKCVVTSRPGQDGVVNAKAL